MRIDRVSVVGRLAGSLVVGSALVRLLRSVVDNGASWAAPSTPDDVVVALAIGAGLTAVSVVALASLAELVTARPSPRSARTCGRRCGLRRIGSASALSSLLVNWSLPAGATAVDAEPEATPHAYAPAPAGRLAAPPATQEASSSTPAKHIVVSGESLWSLAETATATTNTIAQDVYADAVGDCWVRLVEMNGPRLASGDPDVVWPGEVVDIPPC